MQRRSFARWHRKYSNTWVCPTTPIWLCRKIWPRHRRPRRSTRHHRTTQGISTLCLPKSTIYPRMIHFASKGSGQQPVPSAANELTSGTEQAQAALPTDAVGKTPGKIIPENADAMAGVSPPAPPPPKLLPVHAAEPKKETPSFAATVAALEPHVSGHGVVVDAANRIGVPSFLGEPLRVAVESASTAGLALQIVGSGIAREQVPAPGSKVPPGTEIVVRFTR